jgi:hypothetical protein
LWSGTDGATTSAVGTATSTVGAAWAADFIQCRFIRRRPLPIPARFNGELVYDDVVVSAAGYVPGYQNRSVGNVTSHAVPV